MVRAPCCNKVGLNRGQWMPEEDTLLTGYIQVHGEGKWRSLPLKAGLLRCGKSCRLRWINYLSPDIKRGNISADEDDLIIRLHSLLGNRWSLIAGRLPGRTDNEIKNHWNTRLCKKVRNRQVSNSICRRQKAKMNKCNNYKNKKNPNLEMEKPEVHKPKPVRLPSLTLSKNDCLESLTSPNGDCYDQDDDTAAFIMLNNSFNDRGIGVFLGGEDDCYRCLDDLINDPSDINIGSHIPTASNDTLEKLYNEYFQLLDIKDDQEKLV